MSALARLWLKLRIVWMRREAELLLRHERLLAHELVVARDRLQGDLIASDIAHVQRARHYCQRRLAELEAQS